MVFAEHPKRNVSVTDHPNGFECSAASDSFAIDMESFSNGVNQETATNSRITLKRNSSRKGCQRSNGDGNGDLSCPKGGAVGSAMPEKPAVVAVAPPEVHHHQIIVSAINNSINLRRNSFRRSSTSWVSDPKRILFFFATLSSLGTIVLLYFTLFL